MKMHKALVLASRETKYLEQVIERVKRKYLPKKIVILKPKNQLSPKGYSTLNLANKDFSFWAILKNFSIWRIREEKFDICVIPHKNWFGKGTISLELFGYLLGAKKTISYSVSLVEYEVNFVYLLKKILFELYKKIFKTLRLYILLDFFYEQLVLARRLKNETSVKMGENSAIRGHSRIDYYENLSIGKNSAVNYGFQAVGRGKIEIGDFVHIGPNVMISTANHNILGKDFDLYPVTVADVKIEDNVWVGANSIILAGVTLGEGSIIGAGSVVRHSIPKNSIALGNPAKIVVNKPEALE